MIRSGAAEALTGTTSFRETRADLVRARTIREEAIAGLMNGPGREAARPSPFSLFGRSGGDMDKWTTADGGVDVAQVMSRIREKIRGRRDLGLYTDEEVDELTALKLQAFADDAGIDPELLARLMAPNHDWNISTDYRIETHRRGWGARAVVALKKLVRPWVRLYTDHPLSRQAQINLYLHYLGTNLVRELVRLQVEHAALRNRVDALQKDAAAKEGGGG